MLGFLYFKNDPEKLELPKESKIKLKKGRSRLCGGMGDCVLGGQCLGKGSEIHIQIQGGRVMVLHLLLGPILGMN